MGDRISPRFPDARAWATPDTEADDSDNVAGDACDALDSVMRDVEADADGKGVTFTLPAADAESRIDHGGFQLVLPRLDASEYGKILLRRAVEHVAPKRCSTVPASTSRRPTPAIGVQSSPRARPPIGRLARSPQMLLSSRSSSTPYGTVREHDRRRDTVLRFD